MTSPPQPPPGADRPVGPFLRPLRDLAALVLVIAPAVMLFVAVLSLIPSGDGLDFSSRTQDSFYSFVNLPVIVFPLAAVLLAVAVKPQHPKAKLITLVAAAEYAVAAFFGLIFGILVGLIQIVDFSVRKAFEELLLRAAWLAVFGLAAYATYLIWRNLYYVPRPKPQPGVYGQPQYGVPGTYPGQPGYGPPPGGYPPGQQQGGWGAPPPGYGAPQGAPGWGQPPVSGQPAPGGPGFGTPAPHAPAPDAPASGGPAFGAPASAGSGSGGPAFGAPAPHPPAPPAAAPDAPASGGPAFGAPASAGPAFGAPAGPAGAHAAPPPGPFPPGPAGGTYGTPVPGPYSEPTEVVPRPEDADRTTTLPQDRPGYGPADQDPPRR